MKTLFTFAVLFTSIYAKADLTKADCPSIAAGDYNCHIVGKVNGEVGIDQDTPIMIAKTDTNGFDSFAVLADGATSAPEDKRILCANGTKAGTGTVFKTDANGVQMDVSASNNGQSIQANLTIKKTGDDSFEYSTTAKITQGDTASLMEVLLTCKK